ncbi:MAG: hypothetical protein ACOYKN_11050 [Pirellula sp.]
MLTRLSIHFCLIALCTLVSSPLSYGDEREELKLRIVELKKHAAQLMEEGRKDKAEGLIREQQELMEKLARMNSEGPSKSSVPSPEQMEKFARSMQQVQHLRIASEHLKLAGMHDMAMDLMRRAEDIEQDLRNAKEKMAEQMRGPKDQPQRDQPQRDQPQRDQPRRDRPERIRPEWRGPDARFNGPEARFIGPDARFNGPDARFNGPEARFNGPEARFNGIEQRLEQLRNENRDLRMMIEKIAGGLGRSDRREKP